MNRSVNRWNIAVVGVALILTGCEKKQSKPMPRTVVTGLTVVQAHLEQMPDAVDVTGSVHARESAAIASQIFGRVQSVSVHEGDPVHAGQVLIALDDAQSHADVEHAHAIVASGDQQVQAAEAEASLARSTLARYQILRDRKTISPQEFDEVERRAQVATYKLNAVQSQLKAAYASEAGALAGAGYTRLSAPFAGIVTARKADPGAMAAPGVPLLEVEKSGPLELDVTVDESMVRSIQKDLSVPVVISALSATPVQGRVAELVPAAESTSHSFLVKIALPPIQSLRSGMFGSARLGGSLHPAVLVPQAAIVTHGSVSGVWALDSDNIASLRYVTLGAKHADDVQVLSGLSAGESVVLSPQDRELGGSKIKARQ
jgi:RND family efflux transporter MFP subunit